MTMKNAWVNMDNVAMSISIYIVARGDYFLLDNLMLNQIWTKCIVTLGLMQTRHAKACILIQLCL